MEAGADGQDSDNKGEEDAQEIKPYTQPELYYLMSFEMHWPLWKDLPGW